MTRKIIGAVAVAAVAVLACSAGTAAFASSSVVPRPSTPAVPQAAIQTILTAPVGSCVNDPVQVRCRAAGWTKPTRYVVSTTPALSAGGQCTLVPGYPYRPSPPGNTAYGKVDLWCTEGGINAMEVWGELEMFSLVYNAWVIVDRAPFRKLDHHGHIESEAFAECNGGYGTPGSRRAYTFHNHATVDRNGVWYIFNEVDKTNTLDCIHKV